MCNYIYYYFVFLFSSQVSFLYRFIILFFSPLLTVFCVKIFLFLVLSPILFLLLITIIFLNILNYIQYLNFLLNDAILFKLFKLPWGNVSFQCFLLYLFCYIQLVSIAEKQVYIFFINFLLRLPKSCIFVVVQSYCFFYPSSAYGVQMICCFFFCSKISFNFTLIEDFCGRNSLHLPIIYLSMYLSVIYIAMLHKLHFNQVPNYKLQLFSSEM